jgi:hypothetical protein
MNIITIKPAAPEPYDKLSFKPTGASIAFTSGEAPPCILSLSIYLLLLRNNILTAFAVNGYNSFFEMTSGIQGRGYRPCLPVTIG